MWDANIFKPLPEAWSDFDWRIALVVFVAYIIVDALYAYYTIRVTERRAKLAATSSMFIYILGAIGVLNYVENYLYIIPLALGAWLGSYLVVRHESYRKFWWFKIKK